MKQKHSYSQCIQNKFKDLLSLLIEELVYTQAELVHAQDCSLAFLGVVFAVNRVYCLIVPTL